MRYGTANFKNRTAAYNYFTDYGFNCADVRRKIDAGEIRVGTPPVKVGDTLTIDGDGRYWIAHIETNGGK